MRVRVLSPAGATFRSGYLVGLTPCQASARAHALGPQGEILQGVFFKAGEELVYEGPDLQPLLKAGFLAQLPEPKKRGRK